MRSASARARDASRAATLCALCLRDCQHDEEKLRRLHEALAKQRRCACAKGAQWALSCLHAARQAPAMASCLQAACQCATWHQRRQDRPRARSTQAQRPCQTRKGLRRTRLTGPAYLHAAKRCPAGQLASQQQTQGRVHAGKLVEEYDSKHGVGAAGSVSGTRLRHATTVVATTPGLPAHRPTSHKPLRHRRAGCRRRQRADRFSRASVEAVRRVGEDGRQVRRWTPTALPFTARG